MKFDLEDDNGGTDLYGGKKAKNDFENFDNGANDDFFGGGDDI